MAYKKQYDLVDAVIKRNQEGKLLWSPTFKDNLFLSTIGGHSIGIEEEDCAPLGNEYALIVQGQVGEEIERITGKELDKDKNIFRPPLAVYFYSKALGSLYAEARRKALGVDDILDKLLHDLS